MENNPSSEIPLIKELVEIGSKPKPHPGTGGEFVLVPDGYELEVLRPFEPPLPDGIRALVTLSQPDSFIHYTNDYKDELTRVFADEESRQIKAVIDYHDVEGTHSRMGHRAIYNANFSEQFQRWFVIDDSPMPQAKMAEFLEEAVYDVSKPDHATILEIVNSLTIARKQNLKSDQNLSNGNFQLQYEITDTTRGGKGETLEIPSQIELTIPIFNGGPLRTFKCFFRYRFSDQSGLHFIIKIAQRNDLISHAFQEVTSLIEEGIQLPILYGNVAPHWS